MRRKMIGADTIVVAVLVVLFVALLMSVTVYAEESLDQSTYIPMEATAYCYGTSRCDGGAVRSGICAGKKEWYGKVAAIYEDENGKPGEFLGYYECLDTGGDERIKNGTVLDIYHPDYDWCIEFGRRKVLVELIDGDG